MHLTLPFLIYLVCWLSFCCLAVAIAAQDKALIAMLRAYGPSLGVPWKLALFIPAALFVSFAGAFAWDDSWDVVTGGGMSILTYLTAPFSLGVLAAVWMRRLRRRHLIVVAAAALFSSSWFYDGWLLVRDGFYSSMWLPNLLLSPFLYLAAGLLWNLEVGQDGEVSFALLRNDWPRRPGHKQVGISLVLMTLPFVGIASFILLFSVHWKL